MKIPLKRAVVKEPVLACGVGGKYLDTDKIKGLSLTYLPDSHCVVVERPGHPTCAFHATFLRNFTPINADDLLSAPPQSPKRSISAKKPPRARKPTPAFQPPGAPSPEAEAN